MTTYIVSYDLIKEKDYPKLIEELEKYESCKPLLSVWVIVTEQSAVEIRDHLKNFIDENDKLLVVQVTSPGVGAWRKLGSSISEWLKKHL